MRPRPAACVALGGGDQQILQRQFQLFDFALDLLGGLAEGLLLQLRDAQTQRLDQLWARIVADILAFSACNAAMIAFRSAGSSGRIAASANMPKVIAGH